MLAEGDAKADKGETTEAVLLYKQAFEHILPGMRKISFKHEVKRDVTAREQLREVIRKEIDEDKSPAELHGDEAAMKALGFIPKSLDLKETMLQIYSEEIAAFYDPKTKTMHLIKEPEEKTKKGPSLLERLMGKKKGFDKDENKTVIAHELTHALSDQNHDLDSLSSKIKGDDDRDLALSSLVEGEATLTMFAAQMSDWDGSKMSAIPSATLERTFGIHDAVHDRMASGQGRCSNAARRLRRDADVPLSPRHGLLFQAHERWRHWRRSTPPTIRRRFQPSRSSTLGSTAGQSPDVPMAVELGALEIPGDWKEVTRNVVGEFQIAVLLAKHHGKAAGAGWDGDGFAVFEGPQGRLGLAWLSTWDSEDDAKEFARSYARFQTRKLDDDGKEPDVVPDIYGRVRTDTGAVYYVERRGADVAVVEGLPRDATMSLAARLWKAKKTEKLPFRPPKAQTPSQTK